MWRRAELRRQQWQIKRRELELVAARNFLKMNVDLVGQYRFRGFGDKLIDTGGTPNGSAFADLFTGNLQGWRIGLEVSTPVGNRRGHTAVRHAQLQLARQRDLYDAQTLRVSHELGDAFADMARAYRLTRTNYNRSDAAIRQLRAITDKYEAGVKEPGVPEILLENVLAAQSRAVVAASAFYRSLVDFNQAIMRVHYSKGTLLDYHHVYLAEGPWSPAAQQSARRQSQRLTPRHLPCLQLPPPVAAGVHPQRQLQDPEIERLPAATPAE
jgi:outer membrane protein TolC